MGRPRRKRPHPAASARILTAGLSSGVALGLVAGMGVAGHTGQGNLPVAAGPVDHPAPAASGSSAAVTTVTSAVPALVLRPATPAARVRRATPAPRPVTRSHGS